MRKVAMGIFLAFSVSAADQSYFNLHQAAGFLEQFIGGHCPSGKSRAFHLLGAVASPDLKAKAGELQKLLAAKSPTIEEVESFRLSIHELQERLHLPHEAKWHEQLLRDCRG